MSYPLQDLSFVAARDVRLWYEAHHPCHRDVVEEITHHGNLCNFLLRV